MGAGAITHSQWHSCECFQARTQKQDVSIYAVITPKLSQGSPGLAGWHRSGDAMSNHKSLIKYLCVVDASITVPSSLQVECSNGKLNFLKALI